MNKQQRKQIEQIANEVREELICSLELLQEKLQGIMEEEDEKFDNMPDSLKESTNGVRMQDAIDAIDGAISSMDSILSELDYLADEIDDILEI